MSIAAIVRALVAAGASPEMILVAVEAAEASSQDALAQRRAHDAARQRKHRERNVMSRDVTVTERDISLAPLDPPALPPTPPNSPPYNPPEPSISVHRKRSAPSEFFDRFWNAYPRREGANPKQPALKAFNRAVSGGADPEAIISGARKYADGQAGKDARFVAQAVTWLNQRRWEDEVSATATGPPIAEVPRFETHEEHLAWWRERQARA